MGFQFTLRPAPKGKKKSNEGLFRIRLRGYHKSSKPQEHTFPLLIYRNEWDEKRENLKFSKRLVDRIGEDTYEQFSQHLEDIKKRRFLLQLQVKKDEKTLLQAFGELLDKSSKKLVGEFIRKHCPLKNYESTFARVAKHQAVEWSEYTWSYVNAKAIQEWAKSLDGKVSSKSISSYCKMIAAVTSRAQDHGVLSKSFEFPSHLTKDNTLAGERKYRSKEFWPLVVGKSFNKEELTASGFMILSIIWNGNDLTDLLKAKKNSFVNEQGSLYRSFEEATKAIKNKQGVFYSFKRTKTAELGNTFSIYIRITSSVLALIESINELNGIDIYNHEKDLLFPFIKGEAQNWWHNKSCNATLTRLANRPETFGWVNVRSSWLNVATSKGIEKEVRERMQGRVPSGSERNYHNSLAMLERMIEAQRVVCVEFHIAELIKMWLINKESPQRELDARNDQGIEFIRSLMKSLPKPQSGGMEEHF